MLSLQGMIAKDLDAQGVLPQKFKDLILGPKYPLIKFVNSKGIVPTDSALPIDTYKFVYEDECDLDWINSDWDLEFYEYVSAVANSSDTSKNVFRIQTLLRSCWGFRSYLPSSGSWNTNTMYNFSETTNAQSYKPKYVNIKLIHIKSKPYLVECKFRHALTFEAMKNKAWSASKYCHIQEGTNWIFNLSVERCGTNEMGSSSWAFQQGQVHFDDMKFTYNDRVILGE